MKENVVQASRLFWSGEWEGETKVWGKCQLVVLFKDNKQATIDVADSVCKEYVEPPPVPSFPFQLFGHPAPAEPPVEPQKEYRADGPLAIIRS